LARVFAKQVQSEGIDAVALCENPLPRSLGKESLGDGAAVALPQSVLRVVFEALPAPDEHGMVPASVADVDSELPLT
jgi:hypothetical protein